MQYNKKFHPLWRVIESSYYNSAGGRCKDFIDENPEFLLAIQKYTAGKHPRQPFPSFFQQRRRGKHAIFQPILPAKHDGGELQRLVQKIEVLPQMPLGFGHVIFGPRLGAGRNGDQELSSVDLADDAVGPRAGADGMQYMEKTFVYCAQVVGVGYGAEVIDDHVGEGGVAGVLIRGRAAQAGFDSLIQRGLVGRHADRGKFGTHVDLSVNEPSEKLLDCFRYN